ncbi:MAG TPA: hypothetical protein VHS78_14350 [Candidatus Elarobacter sp.]|jgi:hypothetical protein|nr:hypothetical protein [Candidatus Elarobacter sp.]
MNGDQTYWIVPRAVLKADALDVKEHRARLAYVLLFSGPALVSDTATVRNRALLLQLRDDLSGGGDGFLQEVIDRRYLTFAIRKKHGSRVALEETARAVAAKPGKDRIDNDAVADTRVLQYIEGSKPQLYEFDSAEDWFKTETLRVFRDAAFREEDLPSRDREALVGVLQSYVDDGEFFGLADFNRGSVLWKRIEERVGDHTVFDRTGDFAHAVARGPYSTCLPKILGVPPTYSSEDAIGLMYWHGVKSTKPPIRVRRARRSRRLRLSDFVAGLLRLTAKDIHDLRSSDERTQFDDALRLYSAVLTDFDNVLAAQEYYLRRIDDRIMQRLGGLTLHDDLLYGTADLTGMTLEEAGWIIFEFYFHVIADLLTHGGYSAVRFLWDRYGESYNREVEARKLLDDAREKFEAAEVKKEMLLRDFTRKRSARADDAITADRQATEEWAPSRSRALD